MEEEHRVELEVRFSRLEDKYCDLVWLGRTDPFSRNPEVAKKVHEVIGKYPGEFVALFHPVCGEWRHGFNSGVLAAARLLQSYVFKPDDDEDDEDKEEKDDAGQGHAQQRYQAEVIDAEKSFPLLDT